VSEACGFVQVHQVGGDLQFDELVVGQVIVQGVDHPVAIAIAAGARLDRERVGLILGIPGDVEPMSAPTFAIVRRTEQSFDHRFERGRGFIGEKRIDLLRRWRQAEQVEGRAADPFPFGRRADGTQPFRFQPRQHEMIDVIQRPRRIG